MTSSNVALDHREERTWRSYLVASRLLLDEVDRALNDEAGLSLADFGLLSRLEEAGEDGLRMGDLAETTAFSRSRISHAVDRLESSGWVERRSCPTDRRGWFAVLTDEGRKKRAQAGPVHDALVRRHFLSNLPEDGKEPFEEALESITSALGGSGLGC